MVLTLNSLISGNEKFFSCIHKGKILYYSQLSNGNFVSTSADKTIKITNPVTKEILTLDDHKDWVWKVIEFKGKLISISWDNTLKVWKKVDNNYVVEDTIEIKGCAFDIVALSDSEFDVAVCVDADKSLRFINLSNKNEKVIDGVVVNAEKFGEIMFIKENVLCVAAKNNLYLVDITTKQLLNKFENNDSKIEKILVDGDLVFATAIAKDNSKKIILFQISNNTIKKLNENESKNEFEMTDVMKLVFKEKKMKFVVNTTTYNNNNLIPNDDDFNFIANSIDNNKKFTFNLIFKGNVDGDESKKFHDKCDNKGPTVTVCRSVDGKKFGGYTPISWKTEGCWQKDDSRKSFVFNLDRKKKFALRSDYNHALDFHANKLSCFGGYTMQLMDKGMTNKNNLCQACDYEISSPEDLIGVNDGNFQCSDVEIYTVSEN